MNRSSNYAAFIKPIHDFGSSAVVRITSQRIYSIWRIIRQRIIYNALEIDKENESRAIRQLLRSRRQEKPQKFALSLIDWPRRSLDPLLHSSRRPQTALNTARRGNPARVLDRPALFTALSTTTPSAAFGHAYSSLREIPVYLSAVVWITLRTGQVRTTRSKRNHRVFRRREPTFEGSEGIWKVNT